MEERTIFEQLTQQTDPETIQLENVEFRLKRLVNQLPEAAEHPEDLASTLLPILIGRFAVLFNNMLPEKYRVAPQRIAPLFDAAAQFVSPETTQDNYYYAQNLLGLLQLEDASTDSLSQAPLDQTAAEWLSFKAKHRLRLLLSSEDLTSEKTLANVLFLRDMIDGFLPAGYNTIQHTRWRHINYEGLLDPDGTDPCVIWRQLTAAESETLLTRAKQLYAELQEIEPTPELQKRIDWLKTLIEEKKLAHGFALK